VRSLIPLTTHEGGWFIGTCPFRARSLPAGEGPMTSTAGADTRERIIGAAERLFAERGIAGVSLREINRAAQQSNTGAVQYHFGDRDGLVRAIVDKHRRDTEPRRHALLDQYEDAGADDIRTLVAALVMPLAAKLGDPDGGRDYLQVAAEFYSRPDRFETLVPNPDPHASMVRWNHLVDRLVTRDRPTVARTRFATIRFVLQELSRRAAADPRPDDRLFVSHLIDLAVSLLTTHPSPHTRRLATRDADHDG
jgi:AcrR family transcriptional regulator